MKPKTVNAETIQQLLQREEKKGQGLRNIAHESFQEYQFHNLQHLSNDLLSSLLHLAQHASLQTTLLDQILKNYKHHSSSLLSFCPQIQSILPQQPSLHLSHKHSHSQALILALFLSQDLKTKVDLLTCENSLKGVCHLLAQTNEADRLGFAKEAAEKEGVSIRNILNWKSHEWMTDQSIVILDLFGLSPIQYRPFLLSHQQQLEQAKTVVVYHSHLQSQEVSQQFQTFDQISQALVLHLQPAFPIENITEKDEATMLNRLVSFLKEDSERPEKQDAVVFIPADTHVKRFSTKMTQLLSRFHLKEKVNLVTKPHQPQTSSKNNVFLVNRASQLQEWDYDYNNLFYAVDFQTQANFRFDYSLGTYVQSVCPCSAAEKARRMTVVGSFRVGRYTCLSSEISPNLHYCDTAPELSTYLLRMANAGQSKNIEFSNKRVSNCLSLMQKLKIITLKGDKDQLVEIIDQKVLSVVQEGGVNPIQAKLVLNVLSDPALRWEQQHRLASLMVMSFVVLHTQGTLRQGKQEIESVTIKPNGIWRKSGYLESCIEILTKYELIEDRKTHKEGKSQSFRRKTSKFNEFEYEAFGCMFQQVTPKKKGFEDMDEQQFLRDCTVNQELFLQMREEVEQFRSTLEVERLNIILMPQDLTDLIKRHISHNHSSIALYSGIRRQGYRLSQELPSVFPDKKSLMSQLNERPEFLLVTRLSSSQGKLQILMGNAFSAELYLQQFGKLPAKRSQSQSDMQVQFHGISNSTFEELWKNNGQLIAKYEQEKMCFVEPNQEMAMILVHCRKQMAADIKQSFEIILQKIRQKLSQSSKVIHYLGNTNLLLGTGGAVQEIIQTGYIDKCLINNLHLDVSLQDLEELFQDLFVLKSIQVNPPENGKFSKSATIGFNSQRDYYKFRQCFHECLYFDRLMEVKPLIEDKSSKIVKAQQYIEFKWFVWRSHRKALVKFFKQEHLMKAYEQLKKYPTLDEVQISPNLQQDSLIIDNLNVYTDQICIQQAMQGFGQVKQVQILKTPLKEISGEDIYLDSLVKEVIEKQNNQMQQNSKYRLQPVQKAKNGLRTCRLHMQKVELMNIIATQLNKTVGKLGQGRLYAQTWFQTPLAVPPGSMGIYQEILKEVYEEANNPNIHSSIFQSEKKMYLVLKCPIKQTLDLFHQRLVNSLNGYPIALSNYQTTIILSEIGLANLLDLQEKYHCKLIVNQIKRTLHALVSKDRISAIKAEITARVEDHFFYRLSLNRKTFRHLNESPPKLVQIQSTYDLRLVELEKDTMALLLQGSALNVQKAFNFLMHLIESLTVPEEEMINADVCMICCAEPHRPYRLQNCCHKFCRACLLDYINTVLGDNTMFPIKCPHCFSQVVVDDLDSIMEPNQWNKTVTLATNQYVTSHADTMTFCFNAGCKQINPIKGDHIECDVCLGVFCIECKMKYHPGMTCEQAKHGGDALFKKYMQENGVRQCPNEKCKIPVIRLDGCYRVTCTRCQKSMCFKCEPEKMIAYDNYTDCYNHLSKEHGGYW